MHISSLIKLLRYKQWLKNLFVFVPLFFDRKVLEWSYLWPSVVAFVSFCLVSSAIYCLNDIHDVDDDRRHPRKCKRPLASGEVSTHAASSIMAVLVILAGAVSLLAGDGAMGLLAIIGTYFVLNVMYCFWLKSIAIVDVFVISMGFVLRLLAGGVASHILVTHWVVLMTFLLALFLAFAKRRDDVVIYESTGVLTRKNLDNYSLPFINQIIGLIASMTMVCYVMYTVSPDVVDRFGSRYVYLTSVWVLAALIKYLQITIVKNGSGSPTRVLLSNRFLQLCIVCWVLHFALIIYFGI